MALRRSFKSRKRTYPRKSFRRSYRRFRRFNRTTKRLSSALLHVRRSTPTTLTNFTSAAGATEADIQFQFQLADLISYTEFTNLFEFGRLNAVVVTITPVFNQATFGTAVQGIPMIGWAIDKEDNGSQNQIKIAEQGNYKESRFNKMIKIKIMKPKTPMAAFNQGTSTFNGGIMKSGQWQRTSEPGVVYYGLKVAIYNIPVGQTVSFNIRARHYWSFRGTQ